MLNPFQSVIFLDYLNFMALLNFSLLSICRNFCDRRSINFVLVNVGSAKFVSNKNLLGVEPWHLGFWQLTIGLTIEKLSYVKHMCTVKATLKSSVARSHSGESATTVRGSWLSATCSNATEVAQLEGHSCSRPQPRRMASETVDKIDWPLPSTLDRVVPRNRHLYMQVWQRIKCVVRGLDPGTFGTQGHRIAYAATQNVPNKIR